jgi:diacylglycerol O-acyltransferase
VPEGDAFWRTILDPLTDVTLASIHLGGHLWGQFLGLRNDPTGIRNYARVAAAIAQEVGKLALLPNDSPTRFKGKPGTVKRVAWSEPIALPDIKAVGKVLGCSVNDTLLAAVAGALRGYLVARGDPVVSSVAIRAMVPVNLRAASDADELGNRFGLVALELPIGIDNPLARLYATRARMAALKGSYQAMLTFTLLGAAGTAPKFVQDQILKLLTSKTTAVMTNVPGAQQPRYFAGSRIDQQMVWVPQAGDIGMGVSILSYNGRVQFGLITDKNRVDDPEQIVGRFADEFEKLLWLLLLEPWDRLGDPGGRRGRPLAPDQYGRRIGVTQVAQAPFSRPLRPWLPRRRDAPWRPSAGIPLLPGRAARHPSCRPCRTSSPGHWHTRCG